MLVSETGLAAESLRYNCDWKVIKADKTFKAAQEGAKRVGTLWGEGEGEARGHAPKMRLRTVTSL
jgi:hypothetical protein